MMTRTGLQRLKQLGVTDNALTALLLLLGGVTLLPYAAGRQFGPYSIPELLPPSTFWLLALVPPLIWPLLVVPAFSGSAILWRRLFVVIGVLTGLALVFALQTVPVRRVAVLHGRIAPGDTKTIDLELTSPQRVEIVLVKAEPRHDLSIDVCGPDAENCRREQRGEGIPFFRTFPPGRVTVSAFNFGQNPAVEATVEVRYVTQGAFSR